MTNVSGKLRKNDYGRWEFGEIELTSGSLVEILIEDHWILGVIEYWHNDYFWFSRKIGIPVILHHGIEARLPKVNERRGSGD